MSSAQLTLLCLLPSLVVLWLLASQDPKRRRSLRLPQRQPRLPRTPGVALLLLPGLLLGGFGQWPALLMWMGLTLSLGWLLTQLLAWRA
ncbi:hypothetical protein SAMN04488038_104254 [Solimonas aquatica]|uniref:DUF3325 domain-containing protein n=1 Tax=Solimonas aquatica TaxID=489703 RepID=A0A1H9E228_9GAMM|nr:hypothetical protein [Solimonas aquatica]SEQ19796.1 hypothetical protein SAMN04488038_104254 [Solimonas aquatica]